MIIKGVNYSVQISHSLKSEVFLVLLFILITQQNTIHQHTVIRCLYTNQSHFLPLLLSFNDTVLIHSFNMGEGDIHPFPQIRKGAPQWGYLILWQSMRWARELCDGSQGDLVTAECWTAGLPLALVHTGSCWLVLSRAFQHICDNMHW